MKFGDYLRTKKLFIHGKKKRAPINIFMTHGELEANEVAAWRSGVNFFLKFTTSYFSRKRKKKLEEASIPF